MAKTYWHREWGYIWSLLGSAVGFANILSFSALCYKNGGAAFLFPYLIAHFVIGIPMLCLEGSIGQTFSLPLIPALGKSGRSWAKFLGWLSIGTCITIGGFYIVLTGYSIGYIYFTAANIIPDNVSFFFQNSFLHHSLDWSAHQISLNVVICTIIALVLAWSVLVQGIQKGIEWACSLFLPLLVLFVLLFAIAAAALPGAEIGLKHYLVPHMYKLQNPAVWIEAFGQVFFSLSLGLGIVTGYSRYNPASFSIKKSMLKVAIADVAISFCAGMAIFCAIGYLSHAHQVSFDQIVSSHSPFHIGFMIFPTILKAWGMYGRIIGPLFFFTIFIAGITGVFSIAESLIGNLQVEFGFSRKKAVHYTMALITLLAYIFCQHRAGLIIDALAPMVLKNMMLLGGIVELHYFILSKKQRLPLDKDILLKSLLCYIVLPLLVLGLFEGVLEELQQTGISQLVRLSWLSIVVLLAWIASRCGRKVTAA